MRTTLALSAAALVILSTSTARANGAYTPERIAVLPLDGPGQEPAVGRAVSLATAECLLDAPSVELVSIIETERARFDLGATATPAQIALHTSADLVITGAWKRDGKGGLSVQATAEPRPTDPQQVQGRITIQTAGAHAAAVGPTVCARVLTELAHQPPKGTVDPGALKQAARGVNLVFGTGAARDVKAGLRDLEAAATLDADFLLARLLAAELYLMAGKPARAVALLERAAKTKTHAAELLGRAFEQAGQLERARQAYATALEHATKRCGPRVALGDLLAGAGSAAEAEMQYGRAIKHDINCGAAWFSLGLLQHRRSDLQAALKSYTKAARALPGNPDVHYYRGLALASLNKLDEAVAAFRQAVELAPEHPDALRNLGVALLKQGQQQVAIEVLRRYLQAAPPDDPHAAKVRQQLDALKSK